MRIADKMQYDQVTGNLAKNRTTMSELQNQAATQKRVTKPSDDPLAASRVLGNRIDLQSNQQFTKSLNYAKSFLEFTDQSLNDLSEILVRAKELALGQSNDGTGNEESRRVVATEVEQLHNAMVNIGNRKLGDRFIFGGFHTQNAPFDPKGNYHGDSGEVNIHVDKETFVPMNIPGGRVFLGLGVDNNGMAKQSTPQPKTIEEFEQMKIKAQGPVDLRQPASLNGQNLKVEGVPLEDSPPVAGGSNLFRVMRDLEISLKTNDKQGIQESLDVLDSALSQVVLARSQVGSRSMALDSWMQTLEKSKVDNQTQMSTLEDADVFNTVSEINKNQTTLQATLQTSGKLIQPSLLDFLK